jgi:hypothetical protein
MKSKISVPALATLACVTVLTLGASAAQAQEDVYWSIGMSAPGIQLGVSNAPAVVVRPPVYAVPAPVYAIPAPVYPAPRVVYEPPRQVYYRQAMPVHYGHTGYAYGWRGEERFEHERESSHDGRMEGRNSVAQINRNFAGPNR